MFYGSNGNLKLKPRKRVYESGSQVFHIDQFEGWSYQWCFIKKINGVIVFNDYNYSPTTSRHQSDQFYLLRTEFNIDAKNILMVNSVHSLNKAESGLDAFEQSVRDACLTNPSEPDFSHAKQVCDVFKIQFTWEKINKIIEQLEIELADAYLERAYKYAEDKLTKAVERLGARRMNSWELERAERERSESKAEENLNPVVELWNAA